MAQPFSQSPTLTDFMSQLDSIKQTGNYNSPMKLPPPPKPRPAVSPSQPPMAGWGIRSLKTGQTTAGSSLDTLSKLIRAIRSQESDGNYGASNGDSGAAGAYQIMPSNFTQARGGWDTEALGRDITLQEFMNSPQIQDTIARYKLGQYLKKYGSPAAAAVAWYGGPGAVSNMYSHTTQANGYPSLYAYWQSVLSKM
jgi:hypothetical protein